MIVELTPEESQLIVDIMNTAPLTLSRNQMINYLQMTQAITEKLQNAAKTESEEEKSND